MPRKNNLFLNCFLSLICLVLTLNKVNCDVEQSVKLVCSKVDLSVDFPRVISTSFTSESSKSTLNKVEDSSGSVIDTKNVKWLRIESQNKSVKFMPAGINNFFSGLSAFVIVASGLTHLEHNDMKQFGDRLKFSNFRENSLTALEGDVFKSNQNLQFIILSGNPLKHISPELFKNFEDMKLLKVVMIKSGCIDQSLKSPKAKEWNNQRCTDETLMGHNLNRINERAVFFCGGKSCLHYVDVDNTSRTGNWNCFITQFIDLNDLNSSFNYNI